MKKFGCLLLALMLCTSLILPVMANEGLFIPSNGPEVENAVMSGEDVMDCLVITSVPDAKDKKTDITQEERDLLVEVYDALSDGTMKLPVMGGFRYLELSDVSFAKGICRDVEEHDQKAKALKEGKATLAVNFKLDVVPEGELLVFAFIDEKWEQVEEAVHNGEGRVTCVFDDICPVVFIDRAGESQENRDETEVVGEIVGDIPALLSFVPSITYKGGPEIENAITNMKDTDGDVIGDGIDECIVLTTIAQAKNKSTDISQEDRDLLLEIYQKLSDGSMELPLKNDYVITDLVDISFEYEDCRVVEDHGHKDQNLKEKGVTLTLQLGLEFSQKDKLTVMVYVDGQWETVGDVKVNEDGSVICVFEDICPVAFVLEDVDTESSGNANNKNDSSNPRTGDIIMRWVAIMVVCAAGIVIVVLIMKKRKQ